ncbi:hypothetical protein GIB67_013644 [Kingdonia uniflora]|uniref:BRCT domain-containing protein n=1 Tax=Kingdonia uniflora TaxID=39325 RepID=A0A7J7NQH2_9MAGN|nr:hypothetical protein GIB67_013644 [Kingdonia uniflora]
MLSLNPNNPSNPSNASCSDAETQSPPSSPSSCGEEINHLHTTTDDQFETLMLNHDEETQVIDDQGCDETQLLSDGEGSDRTQVLSDCEEDDDNGCCSVSGPPKLFEFENMWLEVSGFDEKVKELWDSCDYVGRPESLWASTCGTARCKTPEKIHDGSGSVSDNNHSGIKYHRKDNGIVGTKDPVKEFSDEPEGEGDNLKLRRLVNKEEPTMSNGSTSDNDSSEAEVLPELLACNQTFAGLSYVGSQEPGEFSQANALVIVDKLLCVSDVVVTPEVHCGINIGGNLPPVSKMKGAQSLAKVIGCKSPVREVHFDWVDGYEDEGGGVLFSKVKHTFARSRDCRQRSCSKHQKPQHLNFRKDGIIADNSTEKEEKSNLKEETSNLCEQRAGLSHSESGIKQNEKEVKNFIMKTQNDFVKKSDEQPSAEISERVFETTGACMNFPDMYDIGYDTQMAAEAMDALFCSTPASDVNQVGQNVSMGASGEKAKERVCSKLASLGKRFPSSDLRDIVRLPKRTKISDTRLRDEFDISSCRHSKKNSRVKKLKPVSEAREKKLNSKPGDKVHSGSSGKENTQIRVECQTFTSIACRTRHSKGVITQKGRNLSNVSTEEISDLKVLSIPGGKRRGGGLHVNPPTRSAAKGKSSKLFFCPTSEVTNEANFQEPTGLQHKEVATTSYDRGRRARRNMLGCLYELGSLDKLFITADGKEDNGHLIPRRKRSKLVKKDLNTRRNVVNELDRLLERKVEPSVIACHSPIRNTTPISASSPVCVRNGYQTRSCKKERVKSSLMREITRLDIVAAEPLTGLKELRRRRDMTSIRVLFSHHLDEEIAKQQKKISVRLGVSVASCISEATHFVTDNFARTRNMLEAIALGKPVVTHLWLESCGQASCFIDENNYILRDSKKEKEIGFSMPVSLARACRRPLLEGKQILITANVKPTRELIAGLVKAVHGQVCVVLALFHHVAKYLLAEVKHISECFVNLFICILHWHWRGNFVGIGE